MPDETKNDNLNIDEDEDDFEAQQNLLGFFKLLLEVDMELDPNFYKREKIRQEKEKLKRETKK